MSARVARRRRFIWVLWLGAVLLWPAAASAAIANFDLAGKIYTKWLYRNNDSQGVLTYGNPFWPDNISGDNGVGSEFELTIFGRVSRFVSAKVRLKSRFGAVWQDWWENGDMGYGPGAHNTSGESLGMNHAEYIKLRGYWMEVRPQTSFLEVLRVGSSDLGMFNPWTIGKVRYIDRDNAKGIFLQGGFGDDLVSYHAGVIALPKLWVGPWWSTGVGDPTIRNPFISRDWAYGVRVDSAPTDELELAVVATLTRDSEIDLADPDARGALYSDCKDALENPVPGCELDGAVDQLTRYSNLVTTAEAGYELLDGLGRVHVLGGLSMQRVDPALVGNGVALNDGVFPIVYRDTTDLAARVRVEIDDPFEIGLSFKAEYFNIGEDWTSIFGARREADVLLTDGLLGGDQLPTLNLANEFIDFDESFAESIIGWHGGTVLLDYSADDWGTQLEATMIRYNTDGQERDVDTLYPDFLHTDGYTDIDLFDYANVLDRGRDPRSVYARNKDRRTYIGVIRAGGAFPVGRGLRLDTKAKVILDQDFRSLTTKADDYKGLILQARAELSYPPLDGLRVGLGAQADRWDEEKRKGTLELGYGDDLTEKVKGFVKATYDYAGFRMGYVLEVVGKNQDREREPDQKFGVVRSKATAEVAW